MKLLLYCTKSKPYLLQGFAKPMHTKDTTNPFNYKWALIEKQTSNTLNGKIVAECDFDVEEIVFKHIHERDDLGILHNESWWEYRGLNIGNYKCELAEKSCLDSDKIMDYLGNNNGYAIHIKNLRIFDEPRDLEECEKTNFKFDLTDLNDDFVNDNYYDITRVFKAPQNMMKIRDMKGYKYKILISIHPEWLCKILNGEKTIEVRKQVLKEMIQ